MIMPETENPDTNVYDMRLVQHEDGWIYGLFCTERRDPMQNPGISQRPSRNVVLPVQKILKPGNGLADLKTTSPQQRNVVLHPEFVNGKYGFYTRPQDGFIDAGNGGGIGFGLSKSIANAEVERGSDRRSEKYIIPCMN